MSPFRMWPPWFAPGLPQRQQTGVPRGTPPISQPCYGVSYSFSSCLPLRTSCLPHLMQECHSSHISLSSLKKSGISGCSRRRGSSGSLGLQLPFSVTRRIPHSSRAAFPKSVLEWGRGPFPFRSCFSRRHKKPMALMRSMLLAASQNVWLREHAVNYPFVRRSVSRFMPGETLEAALAAAQGLRLKNLGSVFTHLGENVRDREEARKVTEHYLEVLDRIHQSNLPTEVSVKLTQLGLDLSPEFCFDNLEQIIRRESPSATIWVDMEASNYVDGTLNIYKSALKSHPNVGLCLQSYLRRTQK